ncbi:MAG: UDP-N-acetylmuramoyl-L-alanyl-D-glutamate--2,6-diaminopimelate ligase [Cyclobacteriaceae bacterium]
MTVLKDILYKVSLVSTSGDMNRAIGGICFDSRESKQDYLFVAVKGTQVNGHEYIEAAVNAGAVAVVCETMPTKQIKDVTYILADNSAEALGTIAANFYGNPSAKMKLVAVTGTNGKTTSVTLLHQLFRRLGFNTGMLSTVENKLNEEIIPATHTTPDAIQLNSLLKEMLDRGCTHCFMEASSHAIHQRRTFGLKFAGAVFTNISHDHLDYHHTFHDYIKAKKMLFDELPKSAFALVNNDDKRGSVMLQNTSAKKYTYGLKNMSDFKARVLSNSMEGLELDLDGKQVWFKLIGNFNAYNLLASFAVACLLGEDPEESLMQLSQVEAARGRFQVTKSQNGVTAIVDYAHTPDALENVLKTIKEFRTGVEKVITVVGAGGNRDRTKRPMMAAVSAKYSDLVILTSDNPRDEEPMGIINDMEEGVPKSLTKKIMVNADRREAIKAACRMANANDIILVAGKGHETYQEVAGVKHDFDDLKIVNEMLELFNE